MIRKILASLLVLSLIFTAYKITKNYSSKIQTEFQFIDTQIENDILILYIKEGEKLHRIDTTSSVFHKYKVVEISKDFILVKSSDVGNYIYTNTITGKWERFPANNINSDDYKIYITFLDKSIDINNNKKTDKIIVLIDDNKSLEKVEIDGVFPYGKVTNKIENNKLIIRTPHSSATIKLNNQLEDTIYIKIEHKTDSAEVEK